MHIDNGASNITTGGLLSLDVDADADDVTGDSATGRLTLGAAQDLNLYHGGTNSYIVNDTGDLILKTGASDEDMIFQGNDGGAAITALTLDMSAAGAATFNSTVTATGLTVDDVAVDGKVITMTGSSGDTFVTTVAANGATSLVTTDAAAAAAHLTITADGTVDINSAGVLTLDSGAAINIEPAAGSAILLDGTISIDAGVVTGATSVTSTAFVGNLTGTVATVTQNSITTMTGLTTTGALNAGSITSGFGAIDNGASAITTTGIITGGTVEATTDTAANDNAAMGYTAAEGLILTGQGSTNDVTIKNDADADVIEIPTGTTNVTVAGNLGIGGTAVANTDTDTSNTGNVTLDFAANQNFVLTLTGNTTLVNPSTEQVGQSGFIAFIQDGTGSQNS